MDGHIVVVNHNLNTKLYNILNLWIPPQYHEICIFGCVSQSHTLTIPIPPFSILQWKPMIIIFDEIVIMLDQKLTIPLPENLWISLQTMKICTFQELHWKLSLANNCKNWNQLMWHIPCIFIHMKWWCLHIWDDNIKWLPEQFNNNCQWPKHQKVLHMTNPTIISQIKTNKINNKRIQ